LHRVLKENRIWLYIKTLITCTGQVKNWIVRIK
jgi:hypothetical protein